PGTPLSLKQSDVVALGLEADQRLPGRRAHRPHVAPWFLCPFLVRGKLVVAMGGSGLAGGHARVGTIAAGRHPAVVLQSNASRESILVGAAAASRGRHGPEYQRGLSPASECGNTQG